MEVLIVGAGAMGRWMARTIDAETTTFADLDPTAAATAAETLGGRSTSLDADERFDVVCIAVPLSIVTEAIAEHASKAERAVVDVSGIMAGPVAAMREHAPDRERLSLHPLFAPENAPGTVAVVADAPGPVTDRVRERIASAGNELFETTVADHDVAMETVQAKAHAAILSFALAADDVPDAFQTPVSSELFGLVETVSGGTPRVYGDIQRSFPGADEVAAAAARIANADDETFERLYAEASSRFDRSIGSSRDEPTEPSRDEPVEARMDEPVEPARDEPTEPRTNDE